MKISLFAGEIFKQYKYVQDWLLFVKNYIKHTLN